MTLKSAIGFRGVPAGNLRPPGSLADLNRCGYRGAWTRVRCARRPVIHVMWHPEHVTTGLCARHRHLGEEHAARRTEVHDYAGACGLPDSRWARALDGSGSRCVIPGLEHLLADVVRGEPTELVR